jgi:hypothetical protein
MDPWGDVFACNVRPDLHMGNLAIQPWSEIISGPKAPRVLEEVDNCQQNCWMAGVAKGTMRNPRYKKLPRLGPFAWVVQNKIRLLLGKNIDFQHYIDYPAVIDKTPAPGRPSNLNKTVKRRVQTKDDQHYSHPEGYHNQ